MEPDAEAIARRLVNEALAHRGGCLDPRWQWCLDLLLERDRPLAHLVFTTRERARELAAYQARMMMMYGFPATPTTILGDAT